MAGLIDANEFVNRLNQQPYDIVELHHKDGQFTGRATLGYYEETIEEVLKQTKVVDAVELPCSVGRSVYVIDGGTLLRMVVNHFEVHRTGVWAMLYDSIVATTRRINVNAKAFGKTVFTNRDDAERALRRYSDATD